MKPIIRTALGIGTAAGAMVFASTPASAAILMYELEGSQPDDYTASFRFDTEMMRSVTLRDSIRYNGLTIEFTRPNSSVVETAAFSNTGVTFRTLGTQGGLFLGFLGGFPSGFQVFGPQLFSGPTNDPTFLTGTFGLSDIPRQRTTDPLQVNYTLTVSEVGIAAAAAVPEPQTWALLLIGFAAVGFGMRRQRAQTKLSYS